MHEAVEMYQHRSRSLCSLSKAMSLLKDPKLCMQTQSNHDKLSDAMTCNSTHAVALAVV